MLNNTLGHRFARDERGHVAMSFGLTFFLMLGTAGGAIDIGRVIVTTQALQNSIDNAALNGASKGSGGAASLEAQALQSIQARATALGAGTVTMTTAWLNATDYQITTSTTFKSTFLNAVPGMPAEFVISTRAVARSNNRLATTDAPSKIDLSYEAADYNRVSIYCFNPSTGARSQFTPIADNGSTSYPFNMPTCAKNETISYHLYNSRGARTSPSNWNRTDCGTSLSQSKQCYNWYTDTRLNENDAETHGGTSPYQLETVLCEDKNCTTLTDGGYIPGNNQRNRIPQKVSKQCKEGKFMYFGWEDRPPQNQGGNGTGNPHPAGTNDPGGDRDYDDIRFIVSCPRYIKADQFVRLIK